MMEGVAEVPKAVFKDVIKKECPDFSKLPDIFDPGEDLPDWGDGDLKIPQFAKEDVTLASNDAGEKRDIKSNGPEDQKFEKDKVGPLEKRGEVCEDIAVRGKPMPDGRSINDEARTRTYWEDKRPSEAKEGGNSWLTTYRKKEDGSGSDDPIAKQRIEARDEYKAGKITKAEAEAKVIIAEHDDHYSKKGEKWSDSTDSRTEGYTDKLGVRLPDTPENQGRVDGMVKELKETGRNPEVIRENGVAYVTYDTRRQ